MLTTVQQWLQSYIDMAHTGSANLLVCDGIPGNCTLFPLDTVEKSRSRSLQGDFRVRYRNRIRILYLSTGPGLDWMEQLQHWLVSQIPEEVSLELTGCKQTPGKLWEHTAVLTVEYDRDYEKEDV